MRYSIIATSLLTIAAAGCTVRAGSPATAASPPSPAAAGCHDADVGNDADHAAAIAATSATTSCTTRGDVDAFAFAAPATPGGSLVRFRLRGESALAAKLEVLDGNRGRVLLAMGRAGETLEGWVHVASGATAYVLVSQVHGVDERYQLDLAATPIDEPGEPNRDASSATPLTLGTPAPGFMGNAAGDDTLLADYYRFVAPAGGSVGATVAMSPEIAARVELLDASGKRVLLRSGGRGEHVRFDARLTAGQTYYVVVGSVYTVERAGRAEAPVRLLEPYELTIAAAAAR